MTWLSKPIIMSHEKSRARNLLQMSIALGMNSAFNIEWRPIDTGLNTNITSVANLLIILL